MRAQRAPRSPLTSSSNIIQFLKFPQCERSEPLFPLNFSLNFMCLFNFFTSSSIYSSAADFFTKEVSVGGVARSQVEPGDLYSVGEKDVVKDVVKLSVNLSWIFVFRVGFAVDLSSILSWIFGCIFGAVFEVHF